MLCSGITLFCDIGNCNLNRACVFSQATSTILSRNENKSVSPSLPFLRSSSFRSLNNNVLLPRHNLQLIIDSPLSTDKTAVSLLRTPNPRNSDPHSRKRKQQPPPPRPKTTPTPSIRTP